MRRIVSLVSVLAVCGPASAQPRIGPDAKEVQVVVDKAYEFLKSRQKADGSFEPARGGPGTTALIAAGLLRLGKPIDDPVVAKALGFLEKSVKADGGIYDRVLANYTTSIAIVTFKEANKGGKYDAVIANAVKFLKSIQQGGPDSDVPFGGVGYDGKSRPDMSNTHFLVEALVAAGVPKDDPAVKNALIFMSRCQNLPGEANKLEYAKKATDEDKGGFVYNPFDANNEKSDKRTPEGGLRSEGGMTYAGLKSFLYAGRRQGRPAGEGRGRLDQAALHAGGEPRAEGRGAVLLLPHVRQGDGRAGRGRVRGREGREARLAEGTVRHAEGSRRRTGAGSNKNGAFLENIPGAGDGVRAVVVELCDEEVAEGYRSYRTHTSYGTYTLSRPSTNLCQGHHQPEGDRPRQDQSHAEWRNRVVRHHGPAARRWQFDAADTFRLPDGHSRFDWCQSASRLVEGVGDCAE